MIVTVVKRRVDANRVGVDPSRGQALVPLVRKVGRCCMLRPAGARP